MKIAILHLSDIHFRRDRESNSILERTEQIAAAFRGLSEPRIDACFVAVTGDIAYSGNSQEYSVALDFFSALRETMAEFSTSSDKFIFVPGNHDCEFGQQYSVRQAIIRDTIRGGGGFAEINQEIVSKCMEVQKEYFQFASLFFGNELTVTPQLYNKRSFSVTKKTVIFRCFNTAWMSELEEKQAQLFFPVHLVNTSDDSQADADLVVTLLHHPVRWFESNNARVFEEHVEANSDIVLTGHEHCHDRFRKDSLAGYTNEYFEGSPLQGDKSGFSAIVVDFEHSRQQSVSWHWDKDAYHQDSKPSWRPFGHIRRSSRPINTKQFSRHLHDLGAAFTHPRKETIILEDMFIYPDLASLSANAWKSGSLALTDDYVGSRSLIDDPLSEALILGSERSGKSTLAKALYLGFQNKRLTPLLLQGHKIKNGHDEEDLKLLIASEVSEQYGPDVVDDYQQRPSNEKVLIVDDLQNAKINQSGQVALLNNLRPRFGNIIALANESYFLSELTQTKPEANGFIAFSSFRLRPMGYRLRGAMVDRWIGLGREYDLDEREFTFRVDTLERKIRGLLGKNLLPSYPLFILMILQVYESQQSLNTASGSYGYYYESLIASSLRNRRSQSIPHDTIYTFVGSIAYKMFTGKQSELSRADFDSILDTYRKKHKVTPNREEMLRVLQEARIFVWDETGAGRFQYRYIYYYFAAKYLSENVYQKHASAEIRTLVSRLIGTLHVEENANIIIFFLYLTKDEESIRTLLERGRSLYDESLPCNFESDLKFAQELITKSTPPQVMLESGDTKSHREKYRSELDRFDDETDEHRALEEENQSVEGMIKLNEALKTLQIMGQVLRNFPGSLEGEIKVAIAKESYLLGLRVLGFFCGFVGPNITGLREVFKEVLREQGLSDEKELERTVDFVLYRVTFHIAFGIIKRISRSVGSEYLAETFQEVSDHRVPTSISLVNLSIKLDHFREFPLRDIVQIYDDVHKNLFTSSIIRGMVVQHLYLFPVARTIRQQVCDRLAIKISNPKLLTGEASK